MSNGSDSVVDGSNPQNGTDANELVKAQLNELECRYYEKLGNFWKQLFLGCTGFAGLVVPFTLQADITGLPKRLLAFASYSTFVAAIALVVPIFQSAAIIKKIWEGGMRGESMVVPKYYTLPMIASLSVFALALLLALAFLCRALYASI